MSEEEHMIKNNIVFSNMECEECRSSEMLYYINSKIYFCPKCCYEFKENIEDKGNDNENG